MVIELVLSSITGDPLATEARFKEKVSVPPLIGLERDFSFILGIAWNYFVRALRMEEDDVLICNKNISLNIITVSL
jgi:hypothetical protein